MANYSRIPAELRDIPQWIVWAYEDRGGPKPTKVPYAPVSVAHRQLANVLDPGTWGSFEQARSLVEHYNGLGFVMTERDEYGLIEFDHTEQAFFLEKQKEIFAAFNTYAEVSPSGLGLHLIGKFRIPQGRKRGPIEMYSQLRYMAMTGDIYRDAPINDIQEKALALWRDLGKSKSTSNPYVDEPQSEDDKAIFDRASKAENGDKFMALWRGEFGALGYPSQSEADFALLDMVAFYTRNREQVRRVFWTSALGQRPKAHRIDYVERMMARAYDRDHEFPDMSDIKACLDLELQIRISQKGPIPATTPEPAQVVQMTPTMGVAGLETVGATEGTINGQYYDINSHLSWPPGMTGEVASFIFEQATHPVREIAIAGALGLMAGITGRSYNTPTGAGLNLYVILLARTGRGKEAMAGGINKLILSVQRIVPAAGQFLGPAEIRSDAALLRALDKQPCMVSIQGEFGLKLKSMLSDYANAHQAGLKSVYLDAYSKSGMGNILRPMVYSEAAKNTGAINWPSFTLLCESTPETFFEIVDEATIKHGLLPRFLTILYEGIRQDSNEAAAFVEPSPQLIQRTAFLCSHSAQVQYNGQCIRVGYSEGVAERVRAFDKECTTLINIDQGVDIKAQMWTRAHLKALKVASILAVGNNPYSPTITLDDWQWAVALVRRDIATILHKFEAGEVGAQKEAEETKQDLLLRRTVKEWLTRPWSEVKGYSGEKFERMHQEKIVPHVYLSRRLINVAVFKNDKRMATKSIKDNIDNLLKQGILQKVDPKQFRARYGFDAETYYISSFSDLMLNE